MSTSEILDSVLNPFTECLTAEAARKIVDFRADRETQNRVDELAAKSSSGQLSVEERSEYQEYIHTFDLVAIVKSKARSVLARLGT
ncbi:MAG TPA: hypothetical protein PLY87_26435 [Planctomycetaceae bacterium]|nr:hypothetical protein [Planctomycetaceae bacterium]HQZ68664.1 hypothetical protein [Planctomycetaceae bacterium]